MKKFLFLVVLLFATFTVTTAQRKVATDKLQVTELKNAEILGTDANGNVVAGKLDAFSYEITRLEGLIANAGKVKTVNGIEPDENGNIQLKTESKKNYYKRINVATSNNEVTPVSTGIPFKQSKTTIVININAKLKGNYLGKNLSLSLMTNVKDKSVMTLFESGNLTSDDIVYSPSGDSWLFCKVLLEVIKVGNNQITTTKRIYKFDKLTQEFIIKKEVISDIIRELDEDKIVIDFWSQDLLTDWEVELFSY